uniref:BTB domain-containing protein n=1 Tax=Panagrolaimus sp. PS1159 TaxID=55785 RepID=A0AC35GT60_9BILA
VHKQVLKDASPVWAGMLESGMKESIENKIEIKDFEFKIVEAAIKLCYRLNGPQKFTFEEMLLFFKFADKYQIKFIMEMIENYLITQISPANIVHLIKFSSPDSLNVKNLYQNCIKFFIQFSKTSTAIFCSDSLDEKFPMRGNP